MKILKFIVYSNLWISFGAALLTLLVYKLNGLETNYNLVGFLFFSTLFSYLFQRLNRLKSIQKATPDSWIVINKKTAKIILFISFTGATLLFFRFAANQGMKSYWILILGMISAGYSGVKLRELPYIKILLIAVSWGIACGVLPFLFSDELNLKLMSLNFAWVFLYIMAITIPFDIRDIGIDEDNQKTIPLWVGIPKAKVIGQLSLIAAFFVLLVLVSFATLSVFLISFGLAWILIRNSFPNNKELYFSFLVDGHIILQFLLVFFFC